MESNNNPTNTIGTTSNNNNGNLSSSSSHGFEEAPTASSDLVWRAEIVKQLFGEVGEVITGDFD